MSLKTSKYEKKGFTFYKIVILQMTRKYDQKCSLEHPSSWGYLQQKQQYVFSLPLLSIEITCISSLQKIQYIPEFQRCVWTLMLSDKMQNMLFTHSLLRNSVAIFTNDGKKIQKQGLHPQLIRRNPNSTAKSVFAIWL